MVLFYRLSITEFSKDGFRTLKISFIGIAGNTIVLFDDIQGPFFFVLFNRKLLICCHKFIIDQ